MWRLDSGVVYPRYHWECVSVSERGMKWQKLPMSETIEQVYTSIFLDEEQDPPLDCMTLKFDYSLRDTWETL